MLSREYSHSEERGVALYEKHTPDRVKYWYSLWQRARLDGSTTCSLMNKPVNNPQMIQSITIRQQDFE